MNNLLFLKKLIKDAVVSAMGGLCGYLETLTESMDALRRAVQQDEKDFPDREFDRVREAIESLHHIPEGVKVTIILEEEE